MIQLWIPVLPPSANNLYERGGRSLRITDEYRAFKYEVFVMLRAIRAKALEGDLTLRAVFYLVKGDTSNRIKALEDALQEGGAFADDKAIVDVHAHRVYVQNKREVGTLVEVAPYQGAEESLTELRAFLERLNQ